MGFSTTLGLLAFFAALCALAAWRDNQPVKSLNPRIIPWRWIIIVSFFAAILMLVHLVNLAGMETGSRTRAW
jgi:hypothetical protein